jgi:hypothetical protein
MTRMDDGNSIRRRGEPQTHCMFLYPRCYSQKLGNHQSYVVSENGRSSPLELASRVTPRRFLSAREGNPGELRGWTPGGFQVAALARGESAHRRIRLYLPGRGRAFQDCRDLPAITAFSSSAHDHTGDTEHGHPCSEGGGSAEGRGLDAWPAKDVPTPPKSWRHSYRSLAWAVAPRAEAGATCSST